MLRRLVTAGVVVLMVGMTAVLLLGLITRGREKAARTRGQENLRRLALLGLGDYAAAHEATFPPGTLPHPTLPPPQRLSLFAALLPHIGRDNLAKQLDPARGWNEPPNAAVADIILPGLLSPPLVGRRPPAPPGPTHYVGTAGRGRDTAAQPLEGNPHTGLFRYDGPTPRAAVTDGVGYTLSFVETSTDIGPWAAGGPGTVRGADPLDGPPLGENRPFGGCHADGANAAMADGSVRFVAVSISPRVFAAMMTIAGGAADEELPGP
jgi:prepilin-type processing-associated H-X9-DG protein